LEYIAKACEIHLGSSPGKDSVEIFFGKSECMFVWIDPSSGLAMVGDALPEKHRAAVAFVGGHADKGEAPKPMQCVTLQPAMMVVDETSGSEDEEDLTASSQSTLLQALQMYTRHLFLPAVKQGKETNVLQDKIRELDVAIGQSQRSARLPHVQLQVDPVIEQVASSLKSTNNLDWQVLGLADKLTDDDVLNRLQSGVSQWITHIRKLTVLPKTTPFPMIAEETNADLEEIAFWNQLNQELISIQQQLSSPGVEVTLALLREAKRFVATLALENNTGLEQALGVAQDVEHFLKSYPVVDFQAARDFEKVSMATNAIFDHLPKVRQSRYYSLERSAQLLEATTLTLRRSMESILHEQFSNFLFMDFKEFENKVRFPTQDVFVQFEDRWEQFKEFFLDQARRRKIPNPAKILEQIVLHHTPLANRLDQVHEFRSNHERLREVVHQVLQDDDDEQGAIQTVESAPRLIFSSLDLLDLGQGGQKALESALEEYDLQMDAMEERLAKLLRDKLTACQDAEDMFRVFARFNPLLTRTRVRVAVKEFQVQLIATVAQAVQKLQSKFTLKYESSSAARIARLRGIPQISGKILWAKQMERQVNALMERMGDVLGPNWGQQLEGRQLRKSGDELLAKLDAKSFFRSWVAEWEKDLTVHASSRLHSYPVVIEMNRDNELFAKVNFDEKSEMLFKEIRHLKWLGFGNDVPKTLSMVSDEASQRYPFGVAIKTALRSYQAVRSLITTNLEPLVMPQLLEVREIISEAFDVKLHTSTAIAKKRRIRWDSPNLSEWVARLSDSVTKLEERVEQLLHTCDCVESAIRKLETVEYSSTSIREVLESIQKSIDEMSMSGYSDLAVWVRSVDDRLAVVLAGRLKTALEGWALTFAANTENEKADGDDGSPNRENIKIASISVDILLRNQEISAVPAVPTVRSLYLNKLHEFIGVVCDLSRPNSSRFEVFGSGAMGESTDRTFRRLIGMVPRKVIASAYRVIEERVVDVSDFIDQWLAYQTLWDTQISDVAATVGKDISKWQALLVESAEARSALDLSATTAEFGPISVKYNKVQSQASR
jgi:dynein heavy chain 1